MHGFAKDGAPEDPDYSFTMADGRSPRLPLGDDASICELECLVTIGIIAGKVAHEINNPLAGIQNAFLLIKDAIPLSHPHYSYVGAIEREINRIASVTRRLAETYRPEQDRAMDVSVSAIVADAVHLALNAAGPGGAPMRVGSQVSLAWPAPAGLLRHVLHQVLEAVVNSADAGYPVVVDVTREADGLRVRVSYHVNRANGSSQFQFPRRLLAALSATCDTSRTDAGDGEVTMQIPLPHRERAIT